MIWCCEDADATRGTTGGRAPARCCKCFVESAQSGGCYWRWYQYQLWYSCKRVFAKLAVFCQTQAMGKAMANCCRISDRRMGCIRLFRLNSTRPLNRCARANHWTIKISQMMLQTRRVHGRNERYPRMERTRATRLQSKLKQTTARLRWRMSLVYLNMRIYQD